MKTVLGPVKSRRLGTSLDINLLPVSCKICNSDCVYCERGLNSNYLDNEPLPTRAQFYADLEAKLADLQASNKIPDIFTFAGNGEPTLHPELPK